MPTHFALLTSKQKKVYSAIESYIKMKGIPPTVREIGEMLGEKTPGAVQGILNRLEQKGVIKRQIGMARSIQLISPKSELYLDPVYIPEIKKITERNVNDILNIYNIKAYHPMSPKVLVSTENCFMFICPDDSLLDTGIKQNDKIIIKIMPQYNEGDIVLALYKNHVLLRKYSENPEHGYANFEADNYIIDKKVFRKNEISIVGKLVFKCSKV